VTIKVDKTFDCVEMMHEAQAAIAQETEGMTREQLLAYWQGAEDRLRRSMEEARRKRQAEEEFAAGTR
jgi:hypothetical protein